MPMLIMCEISWVPLPLTPSATWFATASKVDPVVMMSPSSKRSVTVLAE